MDYILLVIALIVIILWIYKMANTKISALTTLSQADLAATTDFVPVVDTTAGATKKITPTELVLGVLEQSPIVTISSADAGAGAAPDFILYRNSATPAGSDTLGRVRFQGEDSAGNTQTYADIAAVILDPTSTSEDASLAIRTVVAGTEANRIVVNNGVYTPNATGADKGADTINASVLHANSITLRSGQVSFPAVQVASADANTLDDYEEGTWTPSLKFGGGSTGITYIDQSGTYVKVGKIVTVYFQVWLSAKGSSTGEATVTMPFAVSGGGGGVHTFGDMSSVPSGNILLKGQGTEMALKGGAAPSGSLVIEISHANFTDDSVIQGSATYIASA